MEAAAFLHLLLDGCEDRVFLFGERRVGVLLRRVLRRLGDGVATEGADEGVARLAVADQRRVRQDIEEPLGGYSAAGEIVQRSVTTSVRTSAGGLFASFLKSPSNGVSSRCGSIPASRAKVAVNRGSSRTRPPGSCAANFARRTARRRRAARSAAGACRAHRGAGLLQGEDRDHGDGGRSEDDPLLGLHGAEGARICVKALTTAGGRRGRCSA